MKNEEEELREVLALIAETDPGAAERVTAALARGDDAAAEAETLAWTERQREAQIRAIVQAAIAEERKAIAAIIAQHAAALRKSYANPTIDEVLAELAELLGAA